MMEQIMTTIFVGLGLISLIVAGVGAVWFLNAKSVAEEEYDLMTERRRNSKYGYNNRW
jgi:hypothetical protein